MKPLVVGLGNDLLGDDAIGILAARRLATELDGDADVVETGLHGLALIDILAGYKQAVLIDAIQTGASAPGTIIELDPATLRAVVVPSPHYAGLPEMIQLAGELDLEFPDEFRILAVEIAEADIIGGRMNDAVAAALEPLVERVKTCLREWRSAVVR